MHNTSSHIHGSKRSMHVIVRGAALLSALALTAFAPDALAQATRCVVSGTPTQFPGVTVSPAGVAPFRFVVRGIPARATPGADPAATAVHIEGAIVFDGVVAEAHMSLSRVVSASGGILALTEGVSTRPARAAAPDVRADVVLGSGILARDVPLPCDALTLNPAPPPPASQPQMPAPASDGTYWMPRRDTLTLSVMPGSGQSVQLHIETPMSFSMARHSRRGAWSEISWRGGRGVTIRAWANQSALVPMPQGGIGHAGDRASIRCGNPTSVAPRTYQGPATIAAGTTVFAEDGRGAWATVRSEASFAVERVADAPFVRVMEIPGLSRSPPCTGSMPALVPLAAVRLPAGVNWP